MAIAKRILVFCSRLVYNTGWYIHTLRRNKNIFFFALKLITMTSVCSTENSFSSEETMLWKQWTQRHWSSARLPTIFSLDTYTTNKAVICHAFDRRKSQLLLGHWSGCLHLEARKSYSSRTSRIPGYFHCDDFLEFDSLNKL